MATKTRLQRIYIYIYIYIYIIFSASICFADTLYWGTTGSTGDWNTASNWTSTSDSTKHVVPDVSDIVHIGNNSTVTLTPESGNFSNNNSVFIGYKSVSSSNTPGSWSGQGTGDVTINANASFKKLTIGYMYGRTGYDTYDQANNPASTGDGKTGAGSLTVNGNFTVSDSLDVGCDGKGSLTVVGDTATIGSDVTSSTVHFSYPSFVSSNSDNYWAATPTVVDFSGVKDVTITAQFFQLAGKNWDNSANARFRQSADVKLGTNNTINAYQIDLASSKLTNLQNYATYLEFGEGTNTVYASGLVIGGRKADGVDSDGNPVGAYVSIRNNSEGVGGAFTLTGQNGGKADLCIAYNDNVPTANTSYGTLDLSNASQVTMNLDELYITRRTNADYPNDKRDSAAVGTLKLGNNASVLVNTILMSRKDLPTAALKTNPQIATSTIELGGTSEIKATRLLMGNAWGYNQNGVLLEYALSNSTINLSDNARLLVSDAEANGSGYFSSRGEVTITGNKNYTGDGSQIQVQSLWVGFNPDSISAEKYSIKTHFTASGKSMSIGTGKTTDVFYVGAETKIEAGKTPTLISSAAYFEDMENLTVNVDRVKVGGIDSSYTGTDYASMGDLFLAKNNTITSNLLLISDNPVSQTNALSNMELGEGKNVFNISSMTVGGKKSWGEIETLLDGEREITTASDLTIRSTTGEFILNGITGVDSRTKLAIAKDDSGSDSKSNSIGRMNLSNAAKVMMNLETLEIAEGATGTGGGTIAGQLLLGNNATVNVNQIDMSIQTVGETTNVNFSELILGNQADAAGSNHSVVNIIAGTGTDSLGNPVSYLGDLHMGSNSSNSEAHIHMYNGGEINVANNIVVNGLSNIENQQGAITVGNDFLMGGEDASSRTTLTLTQGASAAVTNDIVVKGTSYISLNNSSLSTNTLTMGTDNVLSDTTITLSNNSKITVNKTGSETQNLFVSGTSKIYADNSEVFVYGSMELGTENALSETTINMSNGSTLEATKGINIRGQVNITLTDSTMFAKSISGLTGSSDTVEVSTVSLNGSSHLISESLSTSGATNFSTIISVADNSLLEVVNSTKTAEFIGSTGVTLSVSGGRIIADKVDIDSSLKTQQLVHMSFTGGILSLSQFGSPESSAFQTLTLRQEGTSVMAPGYASPESDLSYSNSNVARGAEVFKGMTRIYGNYVLDSGAIQLEIDKQNVEVGGEVTQYNRDDIYVMNDKSGVVTNDGATGILHVRSPDDITMFINTTSEIFTTIEDGGYMTGQKMEGSYLISSFLNVPLVFADTFMLKDGIASDADWNAWAQEHVIWADGFTVDEYKIVKSADYANIVGSNPPEYFLLAHKVTFNQYVPEPSTWIMLTIGSSALVYYGFRRRKG